MKVLDSHLDSECLQTYVPLVEGLILTQADNNNNFCNCDCVYFISFCTVGRDFCVTVILSLFIVISDSTKSYKPK